MKMRAALLFLVAIVPNVSSTTTAKATTAKATTVKATTAKATTAKATTAYVSSTTTAKATTTTTTAKATTAKATTPQSFIYIRSAALKGCTTGKRVTTQDECKLASNFLRDESGRPAVIKEDKNLQRAPAGCYYYADGKELHFNHAHTDLKKLFAGDEPICKVPGTTTPRTTPPPSTRSGRINLACQKPEWQGDGNCDPGNNNEACGWDKFYRRDDDSEFSDCCKGPAAMKNCKDVKLCKCLDPKFKGTIPTTTKTTTTTTKKATTTPTPTKKATTKKVTTTKKATPTTTAKNTQVTPAKTSGPTKSTEVKTVEDASSRLPSTLWTVISCALIFAAI